MAWEPGQDTDNFEPACRGNLIDKIIQFETEGFDTEEELVDFFQYLINTGKAWRLQGFYGRTAARLIEAGLCEQVN
jgi:hypothetical protein